LPSPFFLSFRATRGTCFLPLLFFLSFRATRGTCFSLMTPQICHPERSDCALCNRAAEGPRNRLTHPYLLHHPRHNLLRRRRHPRPCLSFCHSEHREEPASCTSPLSAKGPSHHNLGRSPRLTCLRHRNHRNAQLRRRLVPLHLQNRRIGPMNVVDKSKTIMVSTQLLLESKAPMRVRLHAGNHSSR